MVYDCYGISEGRVRYCGSTEEAAVGSDEGLCRAPWRAGHWVLILQDKGSTD